VREYLLVLMVALAVTFLVTPLARRVATRLGIMAAVRDRDVHAIPTPYGGGVAMLVGFIAALVVARALPFLGSVFDQSRDARAVLSGAIIICALGIVDDKYDLDAITKLAGQVLAAGVMAAQGIQMLWLPIGGAFLLGPVDGLVLTVLVVVVTINAVNFVDGLDGLAAGIVAIAGAAFFGFSYLLAIEKDLVRATTASLVTAALVGICLGFLPHNFSPARVFMGDAGSMLIGLLLAASTISLTGGLDPNQVGKDVAPAFLPLVLPIAVLLVPLVDLLLAVVRRTRAGRSPFAPDKSHLHHRLLEIGHSHARAVLIMYLWSAVLAFGATAMAFLELRELLISFVVVVVVALLLTVNLPRLRAARRS
jgi:UDP-GlcNAc:undecaprenyl-phosphate/decaprenyl-phosphate GlcNAc-1-phosphate transferase